MNHDQKYTLFIMSYKRVYQREPHPEFKTSQWKFIPRHGFSSSKKELKDREWYEHSNQAWLMFQYGLNAESNLADLEKAYATSYLP
ncbi:hypothetical protein [Acinetobacter sp.]|uniref:hypothetical protein n=1 Tax=Acinetobacter sp. TaxID=472 RepID=UPI003D0192F5